MHCIARRLHGRQEARTCVEAGLKASLQLLVVWWSAMTVCAAVDASAFSLPRDLSHCFRQGTYFMLLATEGRGLTASLLFYLLFFPGCFSMDVVFAVIDAIING